MELWANIIFAGLAVHLAAASYKEVWSLCTFVKVLHMVAFIILVISCGGVFVELLK